MRTKIICTIGPASGDRNTIRRLILAGMSVARLNFSHGKYREITDRVKKLREASRALGKKIVLMGDLQGPKIRIGYFKSKSVRLKEGNEFVLAARKITGDRNTVSVDYRELYRHVSKGDRIFLDDGKIELEVRKLHRENILCRVIVGGELSARKGLSVLDRKLPLPGMTPKDAEDISFGAGIGLDWYAHSFVRKAENIAETKKLLKKHGSGKSYVVAKIEDREGFENIDEIIRASDGIMVARGDLGVSTERALVPLLQKKIIEKCNRAKKPDIVATQILDSMIERPYPTRAEVNDVATAVMQGADYLMLSAETAVGKYPVQTVLEMKKIIIAIEKNMGFY